jgi:hypothetical protein
MIWATALPNVVREHSPQFIIFSVGSHANALTRLVLNYSFVDFVLSIEGVYALKNYLRTDFKNELQKVRGIGWKQDGQPFLNPPEIPFPQ